MPRRTKQAQKEDFTELKRFDSVEELDRAVRKLYARLFEVQGLKSEYVRYNDQKVRNIEYNIRIDILEIFGRNSPEFGEYRDYRIFLPTGGLVMSEAQRHALENENQVHFLEAIPQAEEMLNNLIRRLNEKRVELIARPEPQPRVAFENLKLHPAIASACSDTYKSGHYRESVLNASIALVDYVKRISGQNTLDGSVLMSSVFSAHKPLMAFNGISNKTERDEQEGFMHLFMGAVLALRNPRAHALFDDSPEMALDYIAFMSMLAKRLDDAKRI
jgi:uncharacterized protein (TIGR02391 family)